MPSDALEYEQEIDHLYSLQKYGIKFGLSKTSNLLAKLGNPEKGKNFVHIAGTNGKGSVAVFLASILKQAGYRVGLYTSPHLVRFTERMQINFQEIDKRQATDLSRRVRQAFDPHEPPTFFEAVTAMAIDYFAKQETDLAIMETGMGGRLDATNLIQSLVSVITNISMEHQDFLGRTILEVAWEKAGIIKENTPLLTGAKQKKVLDLLESRSRELNSPFYRLGREITYRSTAKGLSYSGLFQDLNQLELSLLGQHQARNAALALGVCELLQDMGWNLGQEEMRQGLSQALWPGRMQLISDRPKILLDGAHNPAAIKALAQSLDQGLNYKRLLLVFGIMADKDAQAMLKNILPAADEVIFTRPVYERALDPEILSQKAKPLNKPYLVEQSLSKALELAREKAGPEDLILICGSLFTVGEALDYFNKIGFNTPQPG